MNDDNKGCRIVFLGHFASVLERACAHFDVVAAGVENATKGAEATEVARRHDIPVFEARKGKDIVDTIKSRGAQAVIVASFGLILKQEVIGSVEWIVNIHPGLLPECGGRHPLPTAILNRHTTMGLTAHLIDDQRIDHGPVVARCQLPIDYKSGYRANEARLLAELPALVDSIAEAALTGFVDKQKLRNRAYFKPLSPEILDAIFSAPTVGDGPRAIASADRLEETV